MLPRVHCNQPFFHWLLFDRWENNFAYFTSAKKKLIIFISENVMLSKLREMVLNKIQNSEKLLFLLLATRHILTAVLVRILEVLWLFGTIVEGKERVKCTKELPLRQMYCISTSTPTQMSATQLKVVWEEDPQREERQTLKRLFPPFTSFYLFSCVCFCLIRPLAVGQHANEQIPGAAETVTGE